MAILLFLQPHRAPHKRGQTHAVLPTDFERKEAGTQQKTGQKE